MKVTDSMTSDKEQQHGHMKKKKEPEVNASYVLWSKDQKGDISDHLDPNFLVRHQFEHSPFHQSLHTFIKRHKRQPLFHLDIHGKKDRSTNTDIDLGTRALLETFVKSDQEMLVYPLIKTMTAKMNKVFAK
jgi:hypothetical protein